LLTRLKATDNGITVNGEPRYVSSRVHAGDRIEIRMAEETSDQIAPEPIPLDIVYEDAHLLIVNKAAGIVVHPTHGQYAHTLANAVAHHWLTRGERRRFRPVHRLDQDTSGLLAIAKNPYVHQQLAEQMHSGQMVKEYTAVVRGRLPQPEGAVDAPIGRIPEEPHRRVVTPDGYPALTLYQALREFPGATLVRLRLLTGRTHQIRVHMRHLGCPLFGDKLYGPPNLSAAEPIGRQALHASRLRLLHPAENRWMEWEADLPPDMRQLLDQLERAASANQQPADQERRGT
jgi:23S rRNA pseudouridine1911/1915/1917 synthase